MTKLSLVLSSLALSFILLSGCSSTSTAQFDDENIIMDVVDTQVDDLGISKTIRVMNKTGFELDDLTLGLGYVEVKSENNSNNYMEDLDLQNFEDISLNKGENIEISFYHSFDGHKKSINVDNPQIEFKGNVIDGSEKKPFNMVGSLQLFLVNN
ncbi:hypothetical protein CEY16_13180 [Halalkalibacillus sediminis]|uniref:Lipoprotein n=1 Tax=Halalkalibacillus sediminis TaxID=2018042 RepID=A0A2I0QR07_9BACI|nr:hypothetical protein [Halalkalibacillus sediminis]PKR76767.1 hypothetical protein CEY16_13180 [Halalkalibacillus sediminis]